MIFFKNEFDKVLNQYYYFLLGKLSKILIFNPPWFQGFGIE